MATINSEAARNDTLGHMQDLLSVNIDSQKGFQEAAESTKDLSLKQLFTEFGQTRAHNAAELRQYIMSQGAEPQAAGSFSGTLHRWWIDAKQALTGNDNVSILNEAERGEDSIKHMYEEAMMAIGLHDHQARELVERQFKNVKEGHDRVKTLRDSYRLQNSKT